MRALGTVALGGLFMYTIRSVRVVQTITISYKISKTAPFSLVSRQEHLPCGLVDRSRRTQAPLTWRSVTGDCLTARPTE